MDNEIKNLIVDTLYDRAQAQAQAHSCFVVNESGMKLLKRGSEALPEIERVLRSIVDPRLCEDYRQSPASKSEIENMFSEAKPFRGLNYVLGAYLVIGSKFDPRRLVEFLRSISEPLLLESLANIPVFFQKSAEGFNFRIAPPKELIEFVESQLDSNSDAIRRAAARTIERSFGARTPPHEKD